MKNFDKIKKFLIENKYILFIIILFLGLIIPTTSLHLLNLVNTILLFAILGLLYQIIFPEIPLKSSKILSYTIALILLLTSLTSLQYKQTIYNLISEYVVNIKEDKFNGAFQTKYVTHTKEETINGTLQATTIIKNRKDTNGSK